MAKTSTPALRLPPAAAAAALAAACLAGAGQAQAAAQPLGDSYGKAVAAMPDWSGAWMPMEQLLFDYATAEPKGCNANSDETCRERPPYNAEWEAKYVATLKKNAAGNIVDPINFCVPSGMPRFLGGNTGPYEFIMTPDKVYFILEYFSQTRRIYLNQPHPPEEDLWPTWLGNSVGRWEGDTLVVDTISMMDGVYDRTGAPHSDKVHLVERIRKTAPDVLEIDMTLTDPVAFTRPWKITRHYRRSARPIRFDDRYCENQRNPVVNGETQFVLAAPIIGLDDAAK